jgi:hypothetical protein
VHYRQIIGDDQTGAGAQGIWHEEAEETYEKHQKFLKRDAAGCSNTSWRPRKVYRASSAKVLKMLDNQAMCLDVLLVHLL